MVEPALEDNRFVSDDVKLLPEHINKEALVKFEEWNLPFVARILQQDPLSLLINDIVMVLIEENM